MLYYFSMTTYLFSASDPQGRAVELTQACYTRHILVEHPDLADVDEIEETKRSYGSANDSGSSPSLFSA